MTLRKTGITIRLFTKPSINPENQWKTIDPEQYLESKVPQNSLEELFFFGKDLGINPA